ncbi:MAG TPA: hypothetical protein DCF65_09025 [Chloroflexi bacterium]|nr:hypothetical protein [Chloroflexota bacterium]HAF18791.1 hypothetical protein [Chloroflexota bacterium]
MTSPPSNGTEKPKRVTTRPRSSTAPQLIARRAIAGAPRTKAPGPTRAALMPLTAVNEPSPTAEWRRTIARRRPRTAKIPAPTS